MNLEHQKLELIDWILKLKDSSVINEIIKIREMGCHRSLHAHHSQNRLRKRETPITIEELHKYTASSKVSWAEDVSHHREDRL